MKTKKSFLSMSTVLGCIILGLGVTGSVFGQEVIDVIDCPVRVVGEQMVGNPCSDARLGTINDTIQSNCSCLGVSSSCGNGICEESSGEDGETCKSDCGFAVQSVRDDVFIIDSIKHSSEGAYGVRMREGTISADEKVSLTQIFITFMREGSIKDEPIENLITDIIIYDTISGEIYPSSGDFSRLRNSGLSIDNLSFIGSKNISIDVIFTLDTQLHIGSSISLGIYTLAGDSDNGDLILQSINTNNSAGKGTPYIIEFDMDASSINTAQVDGVLGNVLGEEIVILSDTGMLLDAVDDSFTVDCDGNAIVDVLANDDFGDQKILLEITGNNTNRDAKVEDNKIHISGGSQCSGGELIYAISTKGKYASYDKATLTHQGLCDACGGFQICPEFLCVAPPEGCYYEPAEVGKNGCAQGCGNLICDLKPICPEIACAAPPAGCTYGPIDLDQNGCQQSCGELICKGRCGDGICSVYEENDCPQDCNICDKISEQVVCQRACGKQKDGCGGYYDCGKCDIDNEIPLDCAVWYDGCNTCTVRNGKLEGCTKLACFTQNEPYCKERIFGGSGGGAGTVGRVCRKLTGSGCEKEHYSNTTQCPLDTYKNQDECQLALLTGDVCKKGESFISSQSGCLQDDAVCYPVEGGRCTGPSKLDCSLISCPQGFPSHCSLGDTPEGACCPEIICDKNECQPTPCAAPPEGCRYDGNAPVDKYGCEIGCGDLVDDGSGRCPFGGGGSVGGNADGGNSNAGDGCNAAPMSVVCDNACGIQSDGCIGTYDCGDCGGSQTGECHPDHEKLCTIAGTTFQGRVDCDGICICHMRSGESCEMGNGTPGTIDCTGTCTSNNPTDQECHPDTSKACTMPDMVRQGKVNCSGTCMPNNCREGEILVDSYDNCIQDDATCYESVDGRCTGSGEIGIGLEITLMSTEGDYIGLGKTAHIGTYEPEHDTLDVAYDDNVITVTIDGKNTDNPYMPERVNMEFDLKDFALPRVYQSVKRYPFNDGNGGMNISVDSRGCNELNGSFEVHHLGFDSEGNVSSLAIDFVQHCENDIHDYLYGYIRYNYVLGYHLDSMSRCGNGLCEEKIGESIQTCSEDCNNSMEHCGYSFDTLDLLEAARRSDNECKLEVIENGWEHCDVSYHTYVSYLSAYDNDPGCILSDLIDDVCHDDYKQKCTMPDLDVQGTIDCNGSCTLYHCGYAFPTVEGYRSAEDADPTCELEFNDEGWEHCGQRYSTYVSYLSAYSYQPECEIIDVFEEICPYYTLKDGSCTEDYDIYMSDYYCYYDLEDTRCDQTILGGGEGGGADTCSTPYTPSEGAGSGETFECYQAYLDRFEAQFYEICDTTFNGGDQYEQYMAMYVLTSGGTICPEEEQCDSIDNDLDGVVDEGCTYEDCNNNGIVDSHFEECDDGGNDNPFDGCKDCRLVDIVKPVCKNGVQEECGGGGGRMGDKICETTYYKVCTNGQRGTCGEKEEEVCKDVCPIPPKYPAPPKGCEYIGERYDNNGCFVSPGELICFTIDTDNDGIIDEEDQCPEQGNRCHSESEFNDRTGCCDMLTCGNDEDIYYCEESGGEFASVPMCSCVCPSGTELTGNRCVKTHTAAFDTYITIFADQEKIKKFNQKIISRGEDKRPTKIETLLILALDRYMDGKSQEKVEWVLERIDALDERRWDAYGLRKSLIQEAIEYLVELQDIGGSGGGSSEPIRDYCPDGDQTASYYDGMCENAKLIIEHDYLNSEVTFPENVIGGEKSEFVGAFTVEARGEDIFVEDLSLIAGGDDFIYGVNSVSLYLQDKTTQVYTEMVSSNSISLNNLNHVFKKNIKETLYVKVEANPIGRNEVGKHSGPFSLKMEIVEGDATGVTSGDDVLIESGKWTTRPSTEFFVVPVGISNVSFINQSGSYAKDTTLSVGDNTIGIVRITADDFSGNTTEGGDDLDLTLDLITLDTTVSPTTTVGSYTIQRVGGVDAPIEGFIREDIVTFSLDGVRDFMLDPGETVDYIIEAQVESLEGNNPDGGDDYVQVEFNHIYRGQVVFSSSDSSELINSPRIGVNELTNSKVTD